MLSSYYIDPWTSSVVKGKPNLSALFADVDGPVVTAPTAPSIASMSSRYVRFRDSGAVNLGTEPRSEVPAHQRLMACVERLYATTTVDEYASRYIDCLHDFWDTLETGQDKADATAQRVDVVPPEKLDQTAIANLKRVYGKNRADLFQRAVNTLRRTKTLILDLASLPPTDKSAEYSSEFMANVAMYMFSRFAIGVTSNRSANEVFADATLEFMNRGAMRAYAVASKAYELRQSQEPDWLALIYRLVVDNQVDDALDLLFEKMNELLRQKEFDDCNRLLEQVNLQRLNVDLLVGILAATHLAADRIDRERLVSRVKTALLQTETPERVTSILQQMNAH